MTWEIFLGIVALVGFLISICGIVYKLSKVDNHETRLVILETKVD